MVCLIKHLFWAPLLFLLAVACTGPLPAGTPVPDLLPSSTVVVEPSFTPRPTATALPAASLTPSPTPLPAPTVTPTPVAGYYSNPEAGFWFLYPEDWLAEETGQELPSVIIRDNDDPVRLLAGSRQLEAGLDLEEFAQNLGDELNLAESVDLTLGDAASTSDGTPAQKVALSWVDENDDELNAEGIASVAGERGYFVLMLARPEVLSARPRTLDAICASFHISEPELYGVSRANALVLLTQEPPVLDPALVGESPAGITSHLYGGLMRLNPAMQIEPDLAEGWEVSEDGTVYTFHLKAGIAFHNGGPCLLYTSDAADE